MRARNFQPLVFWTNLISILWAKSSIESSVLLHIVTILDNSFQMFQMILPHYHGSFPHSDMQNLSEKIQDKKPILLSPSNDIILWIHPDNTPQANEDIMRLSREAQWRTKAISCAHKQTANTMDLLGLINPLFAIRVSIEGIRLFWGDDVIFLWGWCHQQLCDSLPFGSTCWGHCPAKQSDKDREID